MKTCLLVGSIASAAAFVAGFVMPIYWGFSGALVAVGVVYFWSVRKNARVADLRAERWREKGYSKAELSDFTHSLSTARAAGERRRP